jgi:hypothetical protein
MSGLSTWFGWNLPSASSDELPDIFPLQISQSTFVQTDVVNIFSKILTDVLERTHGIPEKLQPLMWDNCLKSESNDGLISLLSKAMTKKEDLFLIYERAVNVLRLATPKEKEEIKLAYEKDGESSIGIFISFKNFTRSDMINLYSALEYCTVAALNKSMNLSKAIQMKMSDLRGSVSLSDSAEVKSQAKTVALALANGRDVLLDAKDVIETSKPDMEAVKEALLFLNQKRAFYLGLPESYINGEQTGGLGTTGENDTKAVERGLKAYYMSIFKPVIEKLFEIKTSYKSQDFRQISQALEALKTFELTSGQYLSDDNKTLILNKLFDFDEDEKGDEQPNDKELGQEPQEAVNGRANNVPRENN